MTLGWVWNLDVLRFLVYEKSISLVGMKYGFNLK